MKKKTLVLITGATGSVGPLVVKAFHAAGYRIRTLSIAHPSNGDCPDDVEVFLGDVTDDLVVQAAMEGVEAVVHLAALLHVFNPPLKLREKYEHVNINGTATVVDAAIKEGVKRVVLFSTIAVYGQGDGQVIDEQSPTYPDTFYAQTKLAAEEIVLNAKRKDNHPLGTVLRLGAVYGSRIKRNYERLTHSLARHHFIPIGKSLNRRTLVYDKDVGRAAVLAVSHSAAAGQVFNVTDGMFHSVQEVIVAICAALGRKPPRFSLPLPPIRFSAGLIENAAKTFGFKPPINRATVDKYTEDIAVSGGKIRKVLGFNPEYDLVSGWQEAVHEMHRNGDF